MSISSPAYCTAVVHLLDLMKRTTKKEQTLMAPCCHKVFYEGAISAHHKTVNCQPDRSCRVPTTTSRPEISELLRYMTCCTSGMPSPLSEWILDVCRGDLRPVRKRGTEK